MFHRNLLVNKQHYCTQCGINPTLAFVITMMMCFIQSLRADDTEVYLDDGLIEASRPNVIFLLDTSSSMQNLMLNGSNSKLRAVKNALQPVIESLSNVNVGLIEFQGQEVTVHQTPAFVDDPARNGMTVRQALLSSIDGLQATGDRSTNQGIMQAIQLLTGAGSTVNNACQTNHIVLITDGLVNVQNPVANQFLSTLAGKPCNSDVECMTNAVEAIALEDQMPLISGNQNFAFHTIALNADFKAYQDLREFHPDNRYVRADGRMQIQNGLDLVIAVAERGASSFVSPGVSVSQSNRLSHSNKLYYSLFQPRGNAVWAGNMKKYQLVDGQITGVNNIPVVKDGRFNPLTQNAWSSVQDGDLIALGGAANKFGKSDDEEAAPTRNIYSNFSGIKNVDLTADANKLSENNARTLQTELDDGEGGTIDQGQMNAFLKLIKWARGVDVDDEFSGKHNEGKGKKDDNARKIMGDSLHSKPTIVTYKSGSTIREVVFSATNEGYLHVLDAMTGEEFWSFLPLTLLQDVKKTKSKSLTTTHQYGLDGAIVPHIIDSNKNGLLDSGETGYLMVGMRRGGRKYFMLDISDLDNPVLKYIVDGESATFSNLGQSWSKPVFGHINWDDKKRLVTVFGGGYDAQNQDFYGGGSVDAMGSTIYMIDAESGEKLWDARMDTKASPVGQAGDLDNMTNGFTADVAAIDLSGSGLIEVIYALDIRGQLFRFDIDNRNNDGRAGNLAVGGRIAFLGGEGNTENRRFYNAPDISPVRRPNGASYVNISTGSGYRAHPKEVEIRDRFYAIRDNGVLRKVEKNGTLYNDFVKDITVSSLLDITSLKSGQTEVSGVKMSIAQRIDQDSDLYGWYLDLGQGTDSVGEKVLAQSTTFNNRLLFTSYLPNTASLQENMATCTMSYGKSRTYVINVVDGSPVQPSGDRFIDNQLSGIAPEPTILFVADPDNPDGPTDPVIVIGADTPFDRGDGDSRDLLGLSGKRLQTRKWEELQPTK